MRIKNFIDNQWCEYADYDNRRSLPHLIDGLKITQRKALFTAVNSPKNGKPERVSQFASRAASRTDYHHGEVSMMDTVVKLAQDFPGSNNYPLLEKHGQFGSRLSSEASSPRYIHTKLHDNWNMFFHEKDQKIVEYLYDDNENQIEPKFYIPIVPLILINGAEGVGNGYSTKILNYGLNDVIVAIKEIIKFGKIKTPLIPSINGFTGNITKHEKQITLTGKISLVGKNKIIITELPPKYNNDKYKTVLNKLVEQGFIKDYKNHSTEDKWEWIIDCPKSTLSIDPDTLIEKLGLIEKITEQFVCWNVEQEIPITYNSPEELLINWYEESIKLYQKSINNQIQEFSDSLLMLDLQIKFLKWCSTHDFRKLSKAEFIEQIIKDIKSMTNEAATKFVNLPIYKITVDEIEKLKSEMYSILDDLDKLKSCNVVEYYKNKLDNIKLK